MSSEYRIVTGVLDGYGRRQDMYVNRKTCPARHPMPFSCQVAGEILYCQAAASGIDLAGNAVASS